MILDLIELAIAILPYSLKRRIFKILNTYLLRRNFNIYSLDGVTFLGIIKASHPKNLILKQGTVIERKVTLENERLVIVENNQKLTKGTNVKTELNQLGPKVIGSGSVDSKNKLSEVVFVLGTGRSGTNSIIKTVSQNKNIHGIHEPSDELIALAHQFLAKEISNQEAFYCVQTIIDQIQKRGKLVISDQKLVPFIDFLAHHYPESKFIWLIRNPADVVNSGYHRGWFANAEFGYKNRPLEPAVYSSKIFSKFRINGYLCNEFSENEWREMDSFERNCWYWKYWNQLIENQLKGLNRDRWMALSLENLNDKVDDVVSFIGEPNFNYSVTKSNQAKYTLKDLSDWPEKWNNHLSTYCVDYYNHLKQDYPI